MANYAQSLQLKKPLRSVYGTVGLFPRQFFTGSFLLSLFFFNFSTDSFFFSSPPVGNISYDANEEDIKELFAEVGPVKDFRLVPTSSCH